MRLEAGGEEWDSMITECVNTPSETDGASWVALTTQRLQHCHLTVWIWSFSSRTVLSFQMCVNLLDLFPAEPEANYFSRDCGCSSVYFGKELLIINGALNQFSTLKWAGVLQKQINWQVFIDFVNLIYVCHTKLCNRHSNFVWKSQVFRRQGESIKGKKVVL